MIEHARTNALPKPWGVADLRPWNNARDDGNTIGEIWYKRPAGRSGDSSLLLKLLFTSQPLSIQVHPDDAFARSMGMPRGKTEAWYVLSAAPEAKIALGLKQRITPQQLRAAIGDGSIENLVEWRAVSAGEVIFVPAGTIHAIGAGLVIAEIQQRSDATFRLFDYGRQRELHIESALAVADPGPAVFPVQPGRLTDERTMLVSSPYFGFEKVVLPQNSAWRLQSEQETWLLVINGSALAGPLDLSIGDTIFMQSDRIDIRAGDDGMAALVAYADGRIPHMLQRIEQPDATDVERLRKLQAAATPTNGRTAK